TPLFSVNRSITAVSPSGSHSIAIEGLSIANGTIAVTQEGTGPLDAEVASNTIAVPDTDLATGISILSTATAPVPFDVSGNTLVGPSGLGVASTAEGKTEVSGRITNNAIGMGGAGKGIAVDLGSAAASLTTDVIANLVSGSHYTGGIRVQGGADMARVRILDNLVIGQEGEAGGGVSRAPHPPQNPAPPLRPPPPDKTRAAAARRASPGGAPTGRAPRAERG